MLGHQHEIAHGKGIVPAEYRAGIDGRNNSGSGHSATAIVAQRQEGFSAVEVKVYRGDLTPEQFRGLGQIMRDFSGGNARMTVGQNIVSATARR